METPPSAERLSLLDVIEGERPLGPKAGVRDLR